MHADFEDERLPEGYFFRLTPATVVPGVPGKLVVRSESTAGPFGIFRRVKLWEDEIANAIVIADSPQEVSRGIELAKLRCLEKIAARPGADAAVEEVRRIIREHNNGRESS